MLVAESQNVFRVGAQGLPLGHGRGKGARGIFPLLQGLFQLGADPGLAGKELQGLATLRRQSLLAPGPNLV